MKIYSGLKNGAVLQRDKENLCKIIVKAEFNGTPVATLGYFESIDENLWEFKGVFIGGPYTISVTDDDSCITFYDIYVGDVWLLAGQSNMEGAGYPTYEDKNYVSNPYLRALYLEDEWKVAKPIMSNLSKSTDAVHQKTHKAWIDSIKERNVTVRDIPPYEIQRRIGPGLWFAEEMFKLTNGVPQGLILSAVGGASIEMWLPDSENENYYNAASRRVFLSGNNIKGIFWAQGEGNSAWKEYPEQIKKIREKMCNQTGVDEIPFVQMQLFRCTMDLSYKSEECWSNFREMQRMMQYDFPLTETIATNDLELCDRVHLSSDSQKKFGVRAADSMYYLLTDIGIPQPQVESIRLEKSLYGPDCATIINIKYKNLCGELKCAGAPFGFTLRKSGTNEKPTIQNIMGITLNKNVVQIGIEGSIEEIKEYEIFYGFGHDFYCNITDGGDRALPSMGPVRVSL